MNRGKLNDAGECSCIRLPSCCSIWLLRLGPDHRILSRWEQSSWKWPPYAGDGCCRAWNGTLLSSMEARCFIALFSLRLCPPPPPHPERRASEAKFNLPWNNFTLGTMALHIYWIAAFKIKLGKWGLREIKKNTEQGAAESFSSFLVFLLKCFNFPFFWGGDLTPWLFLFMPLFSSYQTYGFPGIICVNQASLNIYNT